MEGYQRFNLCIIIFFKLYADKPLTAFLEYDEHSAVRMVQVYRGKHEQRPGTTKDCSSIIYYAGGKVTRKVERANNAVTKSIFYGMCSILHACTICYYIVMFVC